jgi:HEAT repeat protein
VLVATALAAGCGDDAPTSPTDDSSRDAAADAPSANPAAVRRPRVHADEAPAADPAAPTAAKTPAEWVAVLRDENATDEQRAAAVEALVKIGAPAVPILVDALDDENAYLSALQALGRLGPTAASAAPALLARLKAGANGSEVPVLSRFGPGILPLLTEALADESPTLRRGAANVLTILSYAAVRDGDAETARVIADALAPLLDDPDANMRNAALAGLTSAWKARADTESLLVARLADESPFVRRSAAQCLGLCPGDASAVTDALVRALDDPDPWVGYAAARSIRALGDRAGDARLKLLEFAKRHPEWSGTLADVGVATLETGLRSDDPAVRRVAAAQLAGMGTGAAPATEALLAVADDADPAVRATAIDALSAAGAGTAAAAKVRAAFAAPDANVRAAAARALGRQPNAADGDVASLVRGLADPSADVRRESAIALGRIARQPSVSVPSLVVALDDSDLVVRAAAATALGVFGADAAGAAIDLRRVLAQKDPWIRLGAATSLARIDPPAADAFAVFEQLSVDSSRDVRWRAVLALGTLTSKDAVPIVVERLDDRDLSVRKAAFGSLVTLAATVPEAIPPLETLTKSRDTDLAAAARDALARIRAPK